MSVVDLFITDEHSESGVKTSNRDRSRFALFFILNRLL